MLADVTSTDQTLSIVVVALNEAAGIRPLIASIQKLRKPASIAVETILVDGGSSDGTEARAREAGFTKVVELHGSSIPVCRNRGAAESSGQWLAYVDADCEIAEDWLEQALPLLKEHGEVVLGWPAEPPEPATWVQAAWKAHWVSKNPRTELLNGRPVVRHEGFRLVTTRNMILTRSVFEKLGGFDEELATGEDTDFVFRAYLQNIPVLGLPALRVVHHGEPATLAAFFRQQLWHSNRASYRRIMSKTGGRIGGNAPLFTILFLVGIVLFLAGLAGVVTGCPFAAILLLPLPAVMITPALIVSHRAGNPGLILRLASLYAVYGLARAMEMTGCFRDKSNWKASNLSL
jgi:glycosyltransferase involved in cell wall biosynthesis